MELTIEQALQQGVTAHKEGKLQDAERLYRAILQSQPAHPDANHNLGIIAVSVNRVELALPLFKTALEANPKIEQFWLSYIDALIKERQFDTAKEVLEHAKKQDMAGERLDALEGELGSKNEIEKIGNVSPPQEQLSSLLVHYQNGRFGDAEKLAVSLTKEFPQYPFGWKVLGAILGQTGRKSEAVNANRTLVTLSPQDASAHSNLGITLKELGRLEEAEESLRQALALEPNFAAAHNNLGNTLKELGRLEEAEASYTQALVLNPDYAEAHNNLGVTLQELGRVVEAEASCRQAIAITSNYTEAHYNLGNALKELGRAVEAEASYRHTIALKPNYAEAHHNLGGTLKELGRLEEAEESHRQAIALKYENSEAHTNLGNVLKELGRYAEAEASYRQAIALKADNAHARYFLGVLLFESKQYNMAAEQFNLVDIHQSKGYRAKCSYLLDEEPIFYEKLDALIDQGELDAVIGSLSCSAKIKYGVRKSNPFCKEPLTYVVKTDLNELYDFENIFVKTARNILTDKSVSYKTQGHLTNGIQTAGNIFAQGEVPKTEIESIIRAEIEKYRINFADSEEGFIKHWPADYSIFGWLVCMQSGGELAAHIHENGWITGGIYINVPPKSNTDSGNLVLCMGDQKNSQGADKSQESIIDVVTGSLCFFPSSLHHYTVPFEEEESRIVLAFDVVPKK